MPRRAPNGCASHAYGSVILVTNNYHMPRSLLEMGRLLGDAELEPYPVVNTRLDDGGWLTKPEALRVLFTEYNKYLLALARGVVPLRPTANGIDVVERDGRARTAASTAAATALAFPFCARLV